MAKKKSKVSGKHTKKRIGVNIPNEWYAVGRRLAAKERRPLLWYIIDLLKREAEAQSLPVPRAPWEDPPTPTP